MPLSDLSTSPRAGSPTVSDPHPTDAPTSSIKDENAIDQPSSTISGTQSTSRPYQKYLPILPKPRTETAQRSNSASNRKPGLTLQPQRRCRVKLCVLKHCNLRSHRYYTVPRKSSKAPRRGQIEGGPKGATSHSGDSKTLRDDKVESPLSMIRGGVDGFPVLPLDGPENPIFRELFHSFFSYHYDRIVRLLYPPPRNKSEKLGWESNKYIMLSVGLSTPVYCLNWIASSHHIIVSRRDHQGLDQSTALLYGQIMKLLRAKLDEFDREEAAKLIWVISTVVMLEIGIGRTNNLVSHRKAVHHLIDASGGIHLIAPRAVPIILTLDRLLSIFTCLPPYFTPPSNHLVRRPPAVPVVYGRFLDADSSSFLLGEEVRQYCIDCCRAIELLEWEGLSFDPRDPPIRDSPNLYYFFFLRECVWDEFVYLNVKFSVDKTVVRCVLLTTKIVEYYTLMDHYLSMVAIEMANRIYAMISDQNSDIKWEYQTSLLTWILFVLTSMAGNWVHRDWALPYLRQQLELKYGTNTWPDYWRQTELDGVRGFVWSDTRFNKRFAKTCNDIARISLDDYSGVTVSI